MDSGNSGSLQSSSGGDEEYDSRAAASDSISAFISGAGPISNPPPSFFDPLSNYLQLHQSHNVNSSLIDPNPAWSRITALRSDRNPITHDIMSPNTNMLQASSPTFMPSLHPAAAEADVGGPGPGPGPGPSPTHVPPPNRNQKAARNPKKRSRASRRAPTTVLTTDTTNFRAMVQEFTGIPAPPFDSSSFPRTGRLDLFGSSRSSATSYDATPPPPYLRRPFPQKVHPPLPFLAPTSTSAAAAAIGASSTNTNITSVISSTSNPASNNYQIPITQTSSNPFQNPFLLQTNPKFPFSESMAPSKPQRINPFHIPSDDHSHTQFGLSGGHENNNFIPSSDQISHHNNNTDKDKDHGHDGVNKRSLNGDYNFHHGGGKRPENNVAGEGMVESWICSSE